MHAIMAYMMLAEDGLLPGESRQTLIDLNEEALGSGKIVNMVAFINENFKKRHTLLYQGLIFAIILFYIAQYIYKKTFYKFLLAVKNRIFNDAGVAENEAHSDDFYKELLIDPLTDTNNKAITERDNFVQRGAKRFDTSTFAKYRFDEETPGMTFEEYQQVLECRVQQIDAVINDHLRQTRTELEYSFEIQNKEQPEKLDQLFKDQDKLKAKGNSHGAVNNKDRLRFEALI